MRYGTRTHSSRRWTRQAQRPVCKIKLGYEWGYLYVAICPFTGDVFPMLLPKLDKECFAIFLDQLSKHLKEKNNANILLIGDGAAAHTAQKWQDIKAIDWCKLPTACPELNPVERFFEELRKLTANKVFENLKHIENTIEALVKEYILRPEMVTKLTLFNYLKSA